MYGRKADHLHIKTWTRQGCPLLPLLFVIAIERLEIAIISNPYIYGIPSGGRMHKYALFADNLLLFITDPFTTLPNLSDTLSNFGAISALK